MATQFPMRAKRGDVENGYLVVQQMVEFLRDAMDTLLGKVMRGQATVPVGLTVIVATLPTLTPTYSVVVSPLANPGGNWWISNKTSTQFQINLAAAAPVGGVPFDWIAKGA